MTEEQIEDLGGRQIVRDPISGRFQKVVLDPQTARDMHAARREGGSSARRLLEEQGYTDKDKAPEYITVMAQQAVKHPAAMSHWRRVHSLADQSSEPAAPANMRKVEQVGGSDWLVKLDGVLYRRIGAEAAELARMISDPDEVKAS